MHIEGRRADARLRKFVAVSPAVPPVLGLLAAHALGSAIRGIEEGRGLGAWHHAFRDALMSPSSSLVALAVAYGFSLGLGGIGIAACLGAAICIAPSAPPLWHFSKQYPHLRLSTIGAFAVLCAGVLARPMTPTGWDEFVWLGKARLESVGFGTGATSALNAHAHLMPPGYPTLWPASVGWLSIGADDLTALTVSATFLLLVCCGTFIERLARDGVSPGWASAPIPVIFLLFVGCLGAPLVLVHLRSTYVDLPMGLLGAALFLELRSPAPSPLVAASLAVVLVGFKDEGLAHLLSACAGAAYCRGSFRGVNRATYVALTAGLVGFASWQLALSSHGIGRDHGSFSPSISWFPSLLRLAFSHATELVSWGLFWPITLAALLHARLHRPTAGAALALVLNLGFVCAMLLLGPPRVRAFAENGTLVNRILVQMWPLALLILKGPWQMRSDTK